jgi:hypothetical protein
MAAGLSPPPVLMLLDLCAKCAEHVEHVKDDPATSRRLGSFTYDQESGQYPCEWANMAEFDEWR